VSGAAIVCHTQPLPLHVLYGLRPTLACPGAAHANSGQKFELRWAQTPCAGGARVGDRALLRC